MPSFYQRTRRVRDRSCVRHRQPDATDRSPVAISVAVPRPRRTGAGRGAGTCRARANPRQRQHGPAEEAAAAAGAPGCGIRAPPVVFLQRRGGPRPLPPSPAGAGTAARARQAPGDQTSRTTTRPHTTAARALVSRDLPALVRARARAARVPNANGARNFPGVMSWGNKIWGREE
jgi:hypothetical protein